MPNDVLRLRGLQLYGNHGTEAWEKETGCRFIVDLELEADFSRAVRSDKLGDTLDYRAIFSRVRDVVENESHDLIERVAGRVLDELFCNFELERAAVYLAKPEARIGGINQSVEFRIERTRAEWLAEREE